MMGIKPIVMERNCVMARFSCLACAKHEIATKNIHHSSLRIHHFYDGYKTHRYGAKLCYGSFFMFSLRQT
jgi:hypothetical protein